ncbi:CPBP family intramembrane glutamic endopeptidase [Psychroserpens luteolus]|uniref:CPBP family intramembrane glutamic endopeptidase n=1 Tax=Psychroserpens luteolus TaxID=2855840 RepID=UPI001E4F5758|nr:CPBP family intramembrane glutamic endopeptidase [Psychroserpens luteolus]MCD2260976.1 CPBP family intramembrane metalloprotease [Psychroserpens luteolus]
MKHLLSRYPTATRLILALLFFALALVLSVVIDSPFLKKFFPYTSAILLGVATWLLYKIDNKSLQAIGLNCKARNLFFLPLGLIIGALALLIAKYIRTLFTGESIVLSTSVDYTTVIYALYTILPTVAVEEFLFRGYAFKKTIDGSNVIVANIIFSLLFMLIHVIDENVLQNKGMMVFLIISIPVGHLLFATALLKSKTIFFPIGIHLGNNWATRHLITSGNDGNSFLHTINNVSFETWPPFIVTILLFNAVFLLVTYLIWKWNNFPWLKKKKNKSRI